MNETPEEIRKQMDETKLQLAEKLETLEQQVAATVESTEKVVTATVEAVQGTVQSVTGGVEGAIQSVTNVLDLRRYIERHPLLSLGGAIVVGYLAAEFLSGPENKSPLATTDPPLPATGHPGAAAVQARGSMAQTEYQPVFTPAAPAISPWDQLKEAIVGSLIAVVPEVTNRVVPRLIDQLVDEWDRSRSKPLSPASPNNLSVETQSTDAVHRIRVTPAKTGDTA